ncbi:MAG: response regulator transcription factor [Lachnospiraceae bacterium]|nr:response regulator transcription factor [Lachnospiraceae bacterium]
MYRILVVEDEEEIQEILKNYLEAEGYEVVQAEDGVDGIAKFHGGRFDLIVLDVMMPKIDGFGTCELIRRESDVPIIMLTALEDEACQIRGLDLRADDYITKPFSAPVLMRKIAAVLRRVHKEEEQQQILYKDLRLDLSGHHVYMQDGTEVTEVVLTQKEFEMLHILLLNKGIVLTRQKLLNLVWGEDYFGDERIVDTHIKNIRKKLNQNYISTIRGVGYRIDKENQK